MAHVYAQTADIQGQFKSLVLGATSTPTSSQVDDFIDEEEATVESSVGMKYSVPISSTLSPKAFKIMRKLVVMLVAGRIKNIIAVKSGATETNQGKISDGDAMIKSVMDQLKAIRNGDVILADATLYSSNDGVRSFNVDNEGSVDEDDDVDDINDPFSPINNQTAESIPAFQRGKKAW